MSESTPEESKFHEGTEALEEIAEDMERERENDGQSQFGDDVVEARDMSNAAAISEDNPDVDADSREDH